MRFRSLVDPGTGLKESSFILPPPVLRSLPL